MSTSISIKAYSSTENQIFQKHLKAVKFCIENELSFPKETSEFFKGKLGGDNLEDFKPTSILRYIENGVEVPIKVRSLGFNGCEYEIKTSDIPSEVNVIKITLEQLNNLIYKLKYRLPRMLDILMDKSEQLIDNPSYRFQIIKSIWNEKI